MPGKILFIGAGASYGARDQFLLRPPLGPQLCGWLRRACPLMLAEHGLVDLWGTIEDAEKILEQHASEENFEMLLARLERTQRVSLQRLLKIAFADLTKRRGNCKLDLGFKNEVDGYDDLIKRLNVEPTAWSVVSLNYDILLEDALDRLGIQYFYPHFPVRLGDEEDNSDKVRIYSPHGSIRFFAHGDHKIFHREPTPEDDRGRPTKFTFLENGEVVPNYPIIMTCAPGTENILSRADRSSIDEPVMANYTGGKSIDVNDVTLGSVRKEALQLCSQSDEIVIVGVKPIRDPAYDNFVTEVFSINFRKIIYISGTTEECTLVKNWHAHAETFSNGLLQYLKNCCQKIKLLLLQII